MHTKSLVYKLMGSIVMMLSPFLIQAQIPDPVSFAVTSLPDTVLAGDVYKVTIEASIDGKWHLYSVLNDEDAGPFPTTFSASSDNIVLAGAVEESEADVEFDPNFEAELGWHSTFARFDVPVAIVTNVSGAQAFELEVFYQVCDDRVCLPPTTKTISAEVFVSGVSDSPIEAAQPSTEAVSDAGTPGRLGGEGILSFMWIAVLAGFAALLTPCVFPMIPLTVSYFSKQKEGSGGSGIGRALLFGFSIVATFTLIGIVLAGFVGASGAQNFASNPFVNAFIAVILIGFALSLLGMYEIQLPHQLTNYLNRKSNERSDWLGILFMALTISAVSFSCTAPFVGAVFAATAGGGQWLYPVLGMIGFSAAFASPFVIFALFPGWLEALPKSGSWMNIVKVLLGFIELAAAIKFISNVDLVLGWNLVSRPFAIAAWMAIFLLAGLYMLGIYALSFEKKPETITGGRLIMAIPFFLFSFYLIPGLLGASLGIWDSFLPPKMQTDVSVVATLAASGVGGASAEEGWTQDYEAAIEQAKEENIPVFIDFTGYTCTNCRAMETNVFPLSEVQELFTEMKLVQLYTDGGASAQENQQLQFRLTGNVALPTYVILDPANEQVLAQELGYIPAEKFVNFLRKGITAFQN